MMDTRTARAAGPDPATALAEQQLNPFPRYQLMRASAPVFFDESSATWHVFRYDDVQRVLSDYSVFSSNFGGPSGGSRSDPLAASIVSTDPPRHRQLRALVTQAFTPRAVAALEPRITAIVDEHLGAVLSHGAMDVIADLAYPLPVIVIAELLGVPAADRDRFKQWSDLVVTGAAEMGADPGLGTAATGVSGMQEMVAYFMRMIAARRAAPQDDLITHLLDAQIDGQHLTDEELLGFCVLLLVAGNETTTNLIGNAILCFDEYPEVVPRLQADPALLPNAIEEVLRYRSPVQAMFRHAKADTDLDGHTIRAGQMLIAWIGSANRDETQFPNADRFDLDRPSGRNLAFGHGIHYCLGAPLARLESRVALGAMLQWMADIRRVPDVPLEVIRSIVVYGVKHLPITFTPRAAV